MKEFFQEGELEALGRIVDRWSRRELSGMEAKKTLLAEVLRGKSHVDMAVQSVQSASTTAAERGSRQGAEIGRNLATSLTSALSDTVQHAASNTSFRPNARAQQVGAAAAEAVGFLGMAAGTVVGGVSSAIQSSTQAGMHSREVYVFADRVFLRLTHAQAWELAAQTLGLEGTGQQMQAIEDLFRMRVGTLLDEGGSIGRDAAAQQSSQGKWLRLVQLCLSLELLRHLPAPPVREALPREHVLMQLRLDEEYIDGRMRELSDMVDQMAGNKPRAGPMTRDMINKCCPAEALAAPGTEACPICLEEFGDGDVVRKMPCGHLLHQECGDRWLQIRGTCPTCRCDMRS